MRSWEREREREWLPLCNDFVILEPRKGNENNGGANEMKGKKK